MDTPTAAIYARISQDRYKGEDQEGLNVAEQIEACKRYIESRDWTVGKVYKDESVSATSGAVRPDFERLITDAPPLVVYWKQSRLERSSKDLDKFLLAGCEGYGTDGTRATIENASGELVTRMMSLFGGFEQRNKSEFQKQANLRIAKAGKYRGSIRPFGQTLTGDWVAGEAQAVRRSAKKLADRKTTFWEVAKDWNNKGLLTPQTGKQGGKQWTSGTVRNFYTRPRLIGKQDYNGTLYGLSDWKPLLTEKTWNTIQSHIEENRTGKRGVSYTRADMHLLTSIATCGVEGCGRGMNISYRGGAGSPRAYKCPTPKHLTRTAATLEKYVVERFLDLLMHAGAQELLNPGSQGQGIVELRSRKIKVTKEHAQWIEEAEDVGLKPTIIASKEAKHEKQIAEIDAALFEYEKTAIFAFVAEDIIKDGPQALWTRWESMPVDRQRRVVQALYAEILIKPAAQGKRFSGKYVRLVPTKLHLQLLDLSQPTHEPIPVEDIPESMRERLA